MVSRTYTGIVDMTLKPNFLKFSFLLFFALAGCETIDIRGHDVDADQLRKIKVGVTTKEQVTESLGTPSAVSTFGNKVWFYIADKTSTRAFFRPTVLESSITRIEFDESGRVKTLDSLTEADRQVIVHVHRTTPTAGHEFGVLEQLFGNVGRFNGKDPDADSRRR